jgi:hypothetical protein
LVYFSDPKQRGSSRDFFAITQCDDVEERKIEAIKKELRSQVEEKERDFLEELDQRIKEGLMEKRNKD